MLAILDKIALDLEREFGVGLPRTICYVVEPEMAERGLINLVGSSTRVQFSH